MAHSIYTMYFSPTGGTAKIAEAVADPIGEQRGLMNIVLDLTKPAWRDVDVACEKTDVFVFAFPVYGGRIPEVLHHQIELISGQGTAAIPIAVYGNRDYDDALIEAADLLRERGFRVIAAGAFVGEHSMAPSVGAGRPDKDDLAQAKQFGRAVAQLIERDGGEEGPAPEVEVKGSRPYKDAMADLGVSPVTTDACTKCGICVARCPMGIIDADDPAVIGEGCLRCNACVKACPEDAKHFESEVIAGVVKMLEGNCMARKEPEIFGV